ncbi:hypothetical protein J3R83DRAFT_13062 [Lanmaoa asiatica]|nr:hypothetical protein J3R83DRAFT_13062 [Lanmaoa asiatica]
MRGNVTTYELNTADVASMVEGRLMPRCPSILASLITITFIGQGQLPKNRLSTTFRVRRRVVHQALIWLKANNSDYYGDIEIDEGRLAQLPEDDVPEELMCVVKHSEDTGVVEQESDGYVPVDEDGGTEETRDGEFSRKSLNASGC